MTLVETMVVVTIVGILAASAVPGFAALLSKHRVSTAVGDLTHGLALARSEALKAGRRVYMAPTTTRWHDGWVIFVDRNDNRRFDPAGAGPGDDVIARHDALPASTTITHPTNPAREPFTDVGTPQRTYVLFDGSGYPRQRNGGLNVGSFVVTDRTGPATTVRTICLAAYGRVRIVADRVGC